MKTAQKNKTDPYGGFGNRASVEAELAKWEGGSHPAFAPNLVIGLTGGYARPQLEPFLVSLRKSGFDGQIVFLTLEHSSAARKLMDEMGVLQVPFDWNAKNHFGIINYRWFGYARYLLGMLKDGELPASVFFCDLRDVAFQSDPFAGTTAPIEFNLEHLSIGECKINSKWIEDCYGEEALAELKDKKVSCAGTLYADGVHAVRYLLEIQERLLDMSNENAKLASDQAAHNVIVHRGVFPEAAILENGRRVLTIGGALPDSQLVIRGDNMICAPNGETSAVVHQYDRKPQAIEAIRRQLGFQRMPVFKKKRSWIRRVTKPARHYLLDAMPEPIRRLFIRVPKNTGKSG